MTKSRIRSFINTIKNVREALPDDMALEFVALYPTWEVNKELKTGDRIEYNNSLYKVKQTHITQIDWTPEVALTLFEPLDTVNDGSLERPFIAASGMTYYKDKYYFDETDGKVYLCMRDDTGNGTTLYYMPHDLVGAYFTLV